MKNRLRKVGTIFLMFFVLLSAVHFPLSQDSVAHASSVSAGNQALPDGDYPVKFNLYKDGANELSMMQSYVDPNSGRLTVKDGDVKASFTLIHSSWITSFMTVFNGTLVETTTLNINQAEDKRTVQFVVSDLSARVNAKVKVDITEFGIHEEQPLQIGFDTAGITPPKPGEVSAGVYHIYFSALSATDPTKTSSMESYFVKPAKLTVDENGKKTIRFIVLKSSDTDSLKTKDSNGQFVEMNVVSTNKAANTREVEFEITDLSQNIAARVHNTIAPPQYATNDFQFKFEFGNIVPFIEDGVYSIPYQTLNATNPSKESSMKSYFVNPATLSVQQGKRKIIMTVLKSTDTDVIQTQLNGQMVDAVVKSQDAAANTRVIEFEVRDLSSNILAYVHNTIAPPQYAGNNFLFKFDTSGIVPKPPSAELIGAPTVEPKQVLDLNFRVTGVSKTVYQQVYGQEMTLTYDSNLLELDKAKSKPLIDNFSLAYTDQAAGQLKLNLTGANGQSFYANNAYLMLEFKAKSVTQSAYAPVTLTNIELVNSEGNKLKVNDVSYSITIVPANTTKLNQALASAQDKHDKAEEGVYTGQFPASAISALQTAITTVQSTANNADATQKQVDDALTKLQTAVAAFDASVITNNPKPTQPGQPDDGSYKIKFSLLKDGTNESSLMESYTDLTSGRLTIQNGKKTISLTLKKSSWITSFKTERNGTLVETTTLNANQAEDTRTVQFEVNDVSAKLNARVVVDVPGVVHEDQPLQIAFDASSVTRIFPLDQPLSEGNYNVSLNGSALGGVQTPVSSYLDDTSRLSVQNGKNVVFFKLKSGTTITKLQRVLPDQSTVDISPAIAMKRSDLVTVLAASQEAKYELPDLTAAYKLFLSVTENGQTVNPSYQISFKEATSAGSGPVGPTDPVDPVDPGTPGPGTGNPSGPGTPTSPPPTNIHGIADGTYSINYKILKHGTTERSVMQDYVVSPGTLTVTNGYMRVSFTLKQSKETTSFQVAYDGSLSDTDVVSSDDAKNTRVIQFPVADLTVKTAGWVKVNWPELGYNHSYDVDLTFDKSSIVRVQSPGEIKPVVVKPLSEAYQPGDYAVDFNMMLRGSDQKSITNDFVKKPAKLTIIDGKSYVYLTLTKSKEMPGFKIQQEDGTLADAENVSTNGAENSRIIRFAVKDFAPETKIYAQVRMDWAGHYTGDYDVQLIFNGNDIKPYVNKDDEAKGDKPEAKKWADIQGHWAKAAIEKAIELGIVSGYENGEFRPNGQVTRAEFAVMLSNALKLKAVDSALTFSDLDSIPDWAKPSLAAVAGLKIINGYEDGSFRADRSINRSELVVMIVRALGLSTDGKAPLTFTDADEIPQWAQSSVAEAYRLGLISGRENNTFAPNLSASRAEAVTLILAMLKQAESK
ncbi:NEAT domain-containing protein [Paenibacillus planticolens]|uniref:Heme-binding NEAT domain-containing protein n=1 Tax=Paenibacillus planticolens TaxID=2654976 RepID=A0ABX1ZLA7_9BACL|nr:NEAT domain-containing protein [Paenibacillus planticolens]NOU99414.1 hypothetical protein [Paenibacillus planticolens]